MSRGDNVLGKGQRQIRRPTLIRCGRRKCHEDEQTGRGKLVQIRRLINLGRVPACANPCPVKVGGIEAERAFVWRER